MGLFDFIFGKPKTNNSPSSDKKTNGIPNKTELVRQIQCVDTLRECFRSTIYLDNARKARMVNNMTTFKVALVFAYDGVFKYGVARDVISSSEDYLAVANIVPTLSQMYFKEDKSQFHSIMQDTLESWESHVTEPISALGKADNRVINEQATIAEITKTMKYLTTC